MTKAAILGGTGYTALELLNILLRHPAVLEAYRNAGVEVVQA